MWKVLLVYELKQGRKLSKILNSQLLQNSTLKLLLLKFSAVFYFKYNLLYIYVYLCLFVCVHACVLGCADMLTFVLCTKTKWWHLSSSTNIAHGSWGRNSVWTLNWDGNEKAPKISLPLPPRGINVKGRHGMRSLQGYWAMNSSPPDFKANTYDQWTLSLQLDSQSELALL